jgi:hypothetical protein
MSQMDALGILAVMAFFMALMSMPMSDSLPQASKFLLILAGVFTLPLLFKVWTVAIVG